MSGVNSKISNAKNDSIPEPIFHRHNKVKFKNKLEQINYTTSN